MSRFTVTAAFTVDTVGTAEAVQAEARRQLTTVAYNVGRSYSSWERSNRDSATLDSVTVEVAPEPEPTVTLTESALAAHIQECVEQALAEARTQ
jgi:hypothetical protein